MIRRSLFICGALCSLFVSVVFFFCLPSDSAFDLSILPVAVSRIMQDGIFAKGNLSKEIELKKGLQSGYLRGQLSKVSDFFFEPSSKISDKKSPIKDGFEYVFLSSLNKNSSHNSAVYSHGKTQGDSDFYANQAGETEQHQVILLPTATFRMAYCESLISPSADLFSVLQNFLSSDLSGIKLVTKITSGNLPDGLSLVSAKNEERHLCGLPLAVGEFSFGVDFQGVTDTDSVFLAKRYYSIHVVKPDSITNRQDSKLSIITNNLDDAVVGLPYSYQLIAGGGIPPYHWSSFALPDGFQFYEGTLSGVPKRLGDYNLVFQIEDTEGTIEQAALRLVVTSSELRIMTPSIDVASIGASYLQRIQAQGGRPPYRWLLAGGTLAEGMTLSSDGLLSGQPKGLCDSHIAISVIDDLGAVDTVEFHLVVKSKALTIDTKALPFMRVGHPYSNILAASGGVPPYSWSLSTQVDDALGHISMTSGGIMETYFLKPLSQMVEVVVSDSVGAKARLAIQLQVIQSQLSIIDPHLPILPICQAYQRQLQGEGGVPPYHWSLLASNETSLTVSPDGLLNIRASQSSSINAEVELVDSEGITVRRDISIFTENKDLDLRIENPLTCKAGSECSFDIVGNGGCSPYIFSLISNNSGVEVFSNGILRVNIETEGEYAIEILLKDLYGSEYAKNFVLRITSPDLKIATKTLPSVSSGDEYTAKLEAIGGTKPYRWIYDTAHPLPSALMLYSLDGQIKGKAEEPGVFVLGLEVIDALGATASTLLSLTIDPVQLEILASSLVLPKIEVGEVFVHNLHATGGLPPYTWNLVDNSESHSLAGVLVRDGILTGIVSSVGHFPASIVLRDSLADEVTTTIDIVVSGGKLTIISPSSLSTATFGKLYEEELSATGGLPPYSWELIGQLPPKLTMNEKTGVIQGVPYDTMDKKLTSYFFVKVRDLLGDTDVEKFAIPLTYSGIVPVSQLIAVPSQNKVGLAWDNPRVNTFVYAVIVRSETTYPESLKDGLEIYRGRQDNCVDMDLSNGIMYYYSAFAFHRSHTELADIMSEAPQTARVMASPNEVYIFQHPDPFIDAVEDFSPLDPSTAFNAQNLPGIVLGPPQGGGILAGSSSGVVSLQARANVDTGRSPPYGGSITVRFADNIVFDGEGVDFIVFENPILVASTINNYFIEPAVVDVSVNGRDFFRFPFDFVIHRDASGALALTNQAVYSRGFAGVRPVLSNNGVPDPTNPKLAGGDPFDLSNLPGKPLSWIQYVRITATGENWLRDTNGDIVRSSAGGQAEALSGVKSSGFDLDAVSAIHY